MSKPAVTVEHLWKAFRIGLREEASDTLVGAITDALRSPLRSFRKLHRLNTSRVGKDDLDQDTLWALRDVSFEVTQGEVIGIIGRNGAGKSTLLKILSRVTEPTSGRITVNGRVSSLLEVGTGFHPELTGRENIYMNGTILGMTKREIDRRFDEIVAFSGVERFLDTPTKRYSSGMQVRLAFAVAAHLEPEILIIDEVLAVGDAKFQASCIRKIKDSASLGRTVLFVTHNLSLTKQFCTRAILLELGQVLESGSVEQTLLAYQSLNRGDESRELEARVERAGIGAYRFTDVRFYGAGGPGSACCSGEPFLCRLRLAAASPDASTDIKLDVAAVIKNQDGMILTTLSTHFLNAGQPCTAGTMEVLFEGDRTPLVPGWYALDLWCGDENGDQDYVQDAADIEIAAGCYFDQTDDLRLPNAKLHGSIMIPFRVQVTCR